MHKSSTAVEPHTRRKRILRSSGTHKRPKLAGKSTPALTLHVSTEDAATINNEYAKLYDNNSLSHESLTA